MELSGKTVLITGSSRGIGAAAARAFADAGARVALIARDGDAVAELAGEIGPDRALAIPCDVSVWWQVEAAMRATVKSFGGCDVLLNNAAVIDPIGPMDTLDPEDWGRAMDINLRGVFHGIRAALPVMLAQGAGTVLTVSTGAAHRAMEGWSAYCASKAGVAMLTECLHLEYAARGIRALGLSPGTVATGMQRRIKSSGLGPVARLDWEDHIPPEWPARTLVWMAGSEAREEFAGQELSLRDEDLRRRVGLVEG
ncbi:MAG: SDR family oxidoreductase [Rubellimicrobium sp.]|nr:SDR family oxidoreductase [Rubellimicrobium sp.]